MLKVTIFFTFKTNETNEVHLNFVVDVLRQYWFHHHPLSGSFPLFIAGHASRQMHVHQVVTHIKTLRLALPIAYHDQ